jgi:hypothetical protein
MLKIATLVVLFCSNLAHAVPRGVYIAAPQGIRVTGQNQVTLSFRLPCSNSSPDEWAGNLVAVSDDEGDMVVGLGVVLARSSCTPGPYREFRFTYPLSETGLSLTDLRNGASLRPIDRAR